MIINMLLLIVPSLNAHGEFTDGSHFVWFSNVNSMLEGLTQLMHTIEAVRANSTRIC